MKTNNDVLSTSKSHPNKFWECECCGLLLSAPNRDNAVEYDCPTCKISKCEHGGKFIQISLQEFCNNANIACI